MIIKNGCYTVYAITNKVSGKMYIGTTGRSLKERFSYGWGYRNHKEFFSEIKQLGWENFDKEIIASNLTEQEAFHMEELLISKLRQQYGEASLYNKDGGGKYGKHCQATNEIIKQANLGRVISEETKEKIRVARARQVISHESIMKSAEKNRGKKRSADFCENNGRTHSKRILCVETGKEYSSATEASKDLNVSTSGISQVCKGTIPHIKGLHFKYA